MSGPDPEGATARGITWYDILDVLPGSSADQIQQAYEAKAALLRPPLISGASSKVVEAAARAEAILDAARRVLIDPVNRERYDQAAGLRQSGQGPAETEDLTAEHGQAAPT